MATSIANDIPPPATPIRGRLVVAVLLGLGVAAAGFAWWWNYERGRKTLDFYGPQGAALIRLAPSVEILGGPDGVIDISRAPGLLNARTSLLSDASYVWEAAEHTAGQASRGTGVRFRRGEQSLVVEFDFERGTIRNTDNGRVAQLSQKTAEGWRSYVERQRTRPRTVTPRTTP
jgi:hypothetical protein